MSRKLTSQLDVVPAVARLVNSKVSGLVAAASAAALALSTPSCVIVGSKPGMISLVCWIVLPQIDQRGELHDGKLQATDDRNLLFRTCQDPETTRSAARSTR